MWHERGCAGKEEEEMLTSRPVWDKNGQRRKLQGRKEGCSADWAWKTGKYGQRDKERYEKVKNGRGIQSIRGVFLNLSKCVNWQTFASGKSNAKVQLRGRKWSFVWSSENCILMFTEDPALRQLSASGWGRSLKKSDGTCQNKACGFQVLQLYQISFILVLEMATCSWSFQTSSKQRKNGQLKILSHSDLGIPWNEQGMKK